MNGIVFDPVKNDKRPYNRSLGPRVHKSEIVGLMPTPFTNSHIVDYGGTVIDHTVAIY